MRRALGGQWFVIIGGAGGLLPNGVAQRFQRKGSRREARVALLLSLVRASVSIGAGQSAPRRSRSPPGCRHSLSGEAGRHTVARAPASDDGGSPGPPPASRLLFGKGAVSARRGHALPNARARAVYGSCSMLWLVRRGRSRLVGRAALVTARTPRGAGRSKRTRREPSRRLLPRLRPSSRPRPVRRP